MDNQTKCPCCGDNFDTVASQLLPVWSDRHDDIVCVTCAEANGNFYD